MTDPHTSGMPAVRETSGDGTRDLASVLSALETKCSDGGSGGLARSQKRGILTLILIGLLVGSAFELLTLTPTARTAETGTRASIVFSNAQSGACLGWPPDAPDKPSFVQCRDDHMFEVAKPVGMNSFGEPCQLAVREYLGTRYDPNSRFTISVLWAGDADGTNTGGQNLLCGMQLLGPGGKPIPFKGRIAEVDQSKVFPVGTCLGIDAGNQSTDIPVDCAALHALEVTGSVSLAEKFPGGPPPEPDQRGFIDAACGQSANAYLPPGGLPAAGLALGYQPLSPASWYAGSRQVSCSIGRRAEQGWTPMSGSARTQSPADIQPPGAASTTTTTSDAAPPPVYEQPLVPVPAAPPAPPPSPAPAPSTPASESPTTATTPPPSTTPSESAPPASPSEAPPSESDGPQPGILEIPGLPPITLPGYVPPEPSPAPALGPAPGPA